MTTTGCPSLPPWLFVPGRAPKFCGHSDCTEKVRGRTYCDSHTPEQWGGGYGSTRADRALRTQVLSEEPICRDCQFRPSTEMGHIVARIYGGPTVRENVKGQCRTCNLAQMRADRNPY
jgi:5-methylcytosine-specific restriction endonuclease McrA